jgi:hypothetical protein
MLELEMGLNNIDFGLQKYRQPFLHTRFFFDWQDFPVLEEDWNDLNRNL